MQLSGAVLATGLFALSATAIVTITVESTITVCPCTSASEIFAASTPSVALISSALSTPSIPAASITSTTLSTGAVCTDPSTLGADCSATQHCCLPYSCDTTTLTCINPDEPTPDSSPAPGPVAPAPSSTTSASDSSCTDPSTLGADCTATQSCCLPYTCDVSSFTCVSADD